MTIIKVYQGLESVPELVRGKVLADAGSVAGQLLDVYWIRIAASTMTYGSRYRFKLRGVDVETGGEWEATSAERKVNVPPVGGQISVEPMEGFAVQDSFRLQVTGWKDDQVPMKFAFWLRDNEDEAAADGLVSEWATAQTVLMPLPEGFWKVVSRAKDSFGAESEPILSGDVTVMTGSDDLDGGSLVSAMSESCTDANQVLGNLNAVLDSATGGAARRRLNEGNATQNVSRGLAGNMLGALGAGQQLAIGTGSKGGASQQAQMLVDISTGSLEDQDDDDASADERDAMAAQASGLLANSFSSLEASEDPDAPSGIGAGDASSFINAASNMATLEVPGGGRRLRRLSAHDANAANALNNVASGIGRQLAQSQVASGRRLSDAPQTVTSPGLSIGVVSLPTQVGKRRRRLQEGEEPPPPIIINIPGVGVFGIPVAAMEQSARKLEALGYEGDTSTGVSANQWGGNPFGNPAPAPSALYYN